MHRVCASRASPMSPACGTVARGFQPVARTRATSKPMLLLVLRWSWPSIGFVLACLGPALLPRLNPGCPLRPKTWELVPGAEDLAFIVRLR